ncbi:MAG: flagellar FliJ family protein [Sulfurimonas sp.]|nr:flagellar FliJ family protein [Sulfurimonas sp.]
MEKSESLVQKANADLLSANMALQTSYDALDDIESPQGGTMADFLASRSLLSSGRGLIQHNKEWVNFTTNEVNSAKEKLKADMIEFEKFNYLELQEIQKKIQEAKIQEAKELDEVALMTHARKSKH